MRGPSVDGRPFLSSWLATRCAVSKVGQIQHFLALPIVLNLIKKFADKLVVIVGDLNHHFCVHAPVQGRGAGDSGPPVIHFSGSPRLPSVPEDSASSPSTAAPDGRMVAFIMALLTRAKDEAASFALTGECFVTCMLSSSFPCWSYGIFRCRE